MLLELTLVISIPNVRFVIGIQLKVPEEASAPDLPSYIGMNTL